jgi:hypothetical protein
VLAIWLTCSASTSLASTLAGAHYTLPFRQLDEQRMDSGSRFAELTVIGKNERYLR